MITEVTGPTASPRRAPVPGQVRRATLPERGDPAELADARASGRPTKVLGARLEREEAVDPVNF